MTKIELDRAIYLQQRMNQLGELIDKMRPGLTITEKDSMLINLALLTERCKLRKEFDAL